MNLKICSHKAAATLLTENPKKFDVILISSIAKHDKEEYLNAIEHNANNICCLKFDDISFPRERFTMPELHQVQLALDFARDKEELVVTCTAGMGRSAATAYIVACSVMEPKEAIKILDPDLHIPNEKVVSLGSQILNKPNILEEFVEFQEKTTW